MNLLFSRSKKVSVCVICLCALFYSFKSFVKDEIKDPFLKYCKNSDAYYVHSYQDVTYTKSWIGYKRYISINNKLVVNTTKGVENYAFLNLDEYTSNRIKNIKVRTLKADGSVVELDSSLVFKRNSKRIRFGAINYPIPAVEPGDTIETSYVYYESIQKSDLKSYVNLYSSVPSINTQYTVKAGKDFAVRYKTYNGFQEPAVVSNDSLVYLQFSADKIKGLEVNGYNCLPCEKPYVYYSLESKKDKLRTWKNVYNEEFNFLTQPMAIDKQRSSYYKRWKRRVIGTAKDSSKFYKLKLLYKEVLDNFTMGLPKEKELIKSTGYFLKEERFDPISIRRFYRQLLEDLEIDYWAVFGKNKQDGTIDTDYIRKGEFDHIFFAYENEKGSVKLLYPHENFYKYQIDEIPTDLYNTKAVLVKPYLKTKKKRKDKFIKRNLKLATVDSVSVATINLSGMDYNYNFMQQTVFSNVDIDKKTANFKYRFKVSGGLSTELRSFYDMLSRNKDLSEFYDTLSEFEGKDDTIDIDSVTKRVQNTKKPFAFTISAEGKLNNALTFINDSLVSVSIDKLIQHNQLENSSDTYDLNYYLNYNYADYFMFYLNFPCKIEVLGLESGNIDFKNDFGEYFFELKQSADNQLKFQSNYKILKSLIPKENLEEIKLLNEEVKNVKSKRLIIKLKRTE
ncbi:DUF3857 domain-containing protein [uncultured Kordia sp.]|uniref:DUF3857 domain-containing protein n=1 Tax=uncultured Kordia sp. TaxID=507699 RepID=UPI0026312E22|nr:DUF3857 domain-containing protein [uncultured Kordia sp.]